MCDSHLKEGCFLGMGMDMNGKCKSTSDLSLGACFYMVAISMAIHCVCLCVVGATEDAERGD
eukprot:gene11959-50212_t